ncbi:MAG TPA: gamma-glutamyl-gamma-aminobutyrate hydrolase family protein [Aggregatilineales bacterium]|nr:gamma-glutamyl-gamma-aminobutyrate hydrolase family protein [Aggregatilineales bacterium]
MIGIPGFFDTSSPDKLPPRFAMSRPYIAALEASGALPVILPLALGLDTLRGLFDRVDGLFMAGGGDLNPACYLQDAHTKTEGIDELRDETELLLTRWALESDKPLLGVCRGVQTLNVAAGGTLVQDLSEQWPDSIRHQYFPEKPRSYVAHEISTVPGTRLSQILGGKAHVNSFHHQAVATVGGGFTVAAYAPDGVIEAIEAPGERFIVGVQWHPESLIETDEAMNALFAAFVRAA